MSALKNIFTNRRTFGENTASYTITGDCNDDYYDDSGGSRSMCTRARIQNKLRQFSAYNPNPNCSSGENKCPGLKIYKHL